MPTYTLPDLQYDYGALEPHICGKIMELHHDKHHAGYVKGANETLEKLDEARSKETHSTGSLERRSRSTSRDTSCTRSSGRTWTRRAAIPARPAGGGDPEDFGSFEKFKRQLTEVASTIMGSGWGALVWEPLGGAC